MAGCIKVATIDRSIGLSALSIAAAPLQQLGRLAGQPHLGTHHILQPQLQPPLTRLVSPTAGGRQAQEH